MEISRRLDILLHMHDKKGSMGFTKQLNGEKCYRKNIKATIINCCSKIYENNDILLGVLS